jgi:hypothetical protein
MLYEGTRGLAEAYPGDAWTRCSLSWGRADSLKPILGTRGLAEAYPGDARVRCAPRMRALISAKKSIEWGKKYEMD